MEMAMQVDTVRHSAASSAYYSGGGGGGTYVRGYDALSRDVTSSPDDSPTRYGSGYPGERGGMTPLVGSPPTGPGLRQRRYDSGASGSTSENDRNSLDGDDLNEDRRHTTARQGRLEEACYVVGNPKSLPSMDAECKAKKPSPIRRYDEDDIDAEDGSDFDEDKYSGYERFSGRTNNLETSAPDEGICNRNESPEYNHPKLRYQHRMGPSDGQLVYGKYERSQIDLVSKYQREIRFDDRPVEDGRFEGRVKSEHWANIAPLDSERSYGPSNDARPVIQSGPSASDHGPYQHFEGGRSFETTPLAAMMRRFAVPPTAGQLFSSPPGLAGARLLPPSSEYTSRLSPGEYQRGFNAQGVAAAAAQDRFRVEQSPGGVVALMGVGGSPDGKGCVKFCCHICSFVGLSEGDFEDHMKSHFDQTCPHCSYSSRTEGRLKRHIAEFHADLAPPHDQGAPRRVTAPGGGKPKLLKCRQCKFATTVKEEFWAHSRLHIKKEKQLSCPRCEFVTEFKHHLEYHIRNHVGSKPYKCSKCTYTCVNKSMLNSHMKSHTNIYRYRCASCTYATKYAHSLKIHLRKKKHAAAVVLNEDGSLPTDGMGNFELLSKRGPPKGSRAGPKKPSLDPPNHPWMSPAERPWISPENQWMSPERPRVSPDAYLPSGGSGQWGASSPSRVTHMEVPDSTVASSSPMSQSSAVVPRRDIGGGAIVDVDPSKGGGNLAAPPRRILDQLASATDLPLSLLSSVLRSSSQTAAPVPSLVTPPMRCRLCRQSCESVTQLTRHFMAEHTGEGHEILASFGIRPETLAALTWNTAEGEEPRGVTSSPERGRYVSPQEERLDRCLDVGRWSDASPKIFARDDVCGAGDRVTVKSEVIAATKETPLDLSARSSGDQLSDRGCKRPFDEEDEEEEEWCDSRAASPINETTSQFARRRARKGKACRLDVVSMQMQENWEEEQDGGRDVARTGSAETSSSFERASPAESSAIVKPSSEICDEDDVENQEVKRTRKVKEFEEVHPHQAKAEQVGSSVGQELEPCALSQEQELSGRGVKPSDNGFYMCQHCDMGFRDRVTHSIHMGYHGFSDPFRCNMCGHRSGDRVEFFLHMARVAHE